MNPAAQPLTQLVENEVPVPSHAFWSKWTTLIPGAIASTNEPRLAYDAMSPRASPAVTAMTPGSAAG